jgi:predicted MFS family arabinose efflux permease
LGVATPGALILWLLLAVYGMAIASTLCGAFLVEKGQKLGSSSAFVNQQWLWFNVAQIGTFTLGGALLEYLAPLGALQWAAAIAAVAPVAVIFACVFTVDEEKSAISVAGLKASAAGLFHALSRRHLWVIALFLLFYYFSPGVDTPLYFYMTDHLQFSQFYIGVLSSIGAAGGIAAALFYGRFLAHMSAKALLNLSILVGVLGTLAFLFLWDPTTAAIAHFCYGAASTITLVATLGMAADRCPAGSEGFAFAALVSVTNIASSLADNVGSYLYEHVFHDGLYPLILVAAAFTAVNFLLVPFLNLKGEAHALVAASRK